MSSKVIFGLSVFLVMYFLPVIILRGINKQSINWSTFLLFALGATGMVLFFYHIY
jgi:hypothetical protein